MRMDRTTPAPVGTFAAHRSPIPFLSCVGLLTRPALGP
jgi:hypothetical protein